jgi:hypothetical protein
MRRRVATAIATALLGLAAAGGGLSGEGPAVDFTGFSGRIDLTKNVSASDLGGTSWLDLRIGCGPDIALTNYLRLTALPDFFVRLFDLSSGEELAPRPSAGIVDDTTTVMGLGLSLHAKLESPTTKWYAYAGPRVAFPVAAWKSAPSQAPESSSGIDVITSFLNPVLLEAQAGIGRRFGFLFAWEIAGCYELKALEDLVPPSRRFALSFRALISADTTGPGAGYWLAE